MDKEQRQRAAVQEFIVEDPGGDAEETNYVIRVSGNEVELTRGQLHPWDNASGTGNDETWETWGMDLETLKRLIKHANWCIEKSETFEKAHPQQKEGKNHESTI